MNVGQVGDYIRTQRQKARLSLRSVSAVAGVSIPYLSQIERGLRRPSADILQAVARGLRISAETLYVQAGILDDRPAADVATAITADPFITERQKQALLQIYEAFREEAGRDVTGTDRAPRERRARGAATTPRAMARTSTKKLGGEAGKRDVGRRSTAARARRSAANGRKGV